MTVAANLSESAFAALPIAEKSAYLRSVGAKQRMDLILSDNDARRLVAAMPPQEFFWLMKEVGETDTLGLLQIASAEQCLFILDMELWDGYTFSEERRAAGSPISWRGGNHGCMNC